MTVISLILSSGLGVPMNGTVTLNGMVGTRCMYFKIGAKIALCRLVCCIYAQTTRAYTHHMNTCMYHTQKHTVHRRKGVYGILTKLSGKSRPRTLSRFEHPDFLWKKTQQDKQLLWGFRNAAKTISHIRSLFFNLQSSKRNGHRRVDTVIREQKNSSKSL